MTVRIALLPAAIVNGSGCPVIEKAEPETDTFWIFKLVFPRLVKVKLALLALPTIVESKLIAEGLAVRIRFGFAAPSVKQEIADKIIATKNRCIKHPRVGLCYACVKRSPTCPSTRNSGCKQ